MASLTIVTAADEGYARELGQLLRSIARFAAATRVVVMDLGLTELQRARITKNYPTAEVRAFPFTTCPTFVSQRDDRRAPGRRRPRIVLGSYAWKSVCVTDVMRETGGWVLWSDAATVLTGGLEPVCDALARDGCYLPVGGKATLAEWTHPLTLTRLDVPLEHYDRRNRATGFFALDAAHPSALALAEAWRAASLDVSFVAPEGSHVGSHRFDQSVFTILANRFADRGEIQFTTDEINISSRRPVQFISVRHKVFAKTPSALAPAERAFFALRRTIDVWSLRAWHVHGTVLSGMHRASREHFRVLISPRNERLGTTSAQAPQSMRCDGAGYLADPFLTRFGGGAHVFCEHFDPLTNLGRIVVAAIDPKTGAASSIRDALTRPYHLSYPSLFEHEGELFMVPECHANRSIDIYVCEEFPHRWALKKRVAYGVDAADSALVRREDHVYLITSLRVEARPGRRLSIYSTSASAFPCGPWGAHPINDSPSIDEMCANQSGRSAGALFAHAGALIRPSQRNRDYYGQAIDFHRVDELTPRAYVETRLTDPPISFPRALAGRSMHHVTFDDGLVVVDVRDRIPSSLALRLRLRSARIRH